jgi:hypothetical protein
MGLFSCEKTEPGMCIVLDVTVGQSIITAGMLKGHKASYAAKHQWGEVSVYCIF